MFKVGDRVRVVDPLDNTEYFSEGAEGTFVEEVSDSTARVEFDKGVYDPDCQGCWYANHRSLKLVLPTARSNDPATSKGKRRVNKYEQAVLAQLSTDFTNLTGVGFTGKEIAKFSGNPLNSITPRFAPLRRKGLIKDSGLRRDKQIVWVLA